MSRYERQIILPGVGPEGQRLLADAHILVVGAGGLGVPCLQYLAGAGVGHITIVDPDVISASNLHRQVFYSEKHIGESKADQAAAFLHDLNSEISINSHMVRVDPANVADFCANVSIVLDCADSFAASYILSDYCFVHGIPLISASALALSGHVGGFCGGAPSLRAIFPDLPQQAGSCATTGVLGPIVGTIGSLQAQMALAHLLKLEPSPLGQLVRFDAATYRFSNFRFDGAPEPDQKPLRFISTDEISDDDFIIELRSADEAETLIVPRTVQMSADEYIEKHVIPERQKRAVFVCRSGIRAHRAARHLQTNWDGEIVLVATG